MHFLLRRFGPYAAGAGIVLHVYMLIWILGDLRALALRPIQVEGGLLRLRIGLRWEAEIPLRLIEAVDRNPPGSLDPANGLRLGVIGSPNLRLALREPVQLHGMFGIRRESSSLLLQVDDPDGLAAALR